MLNKNEVIQFTGEEALEILSQVEYILISLCNIARYYYHGDTNKVVDRSAYEKETANFIDDGAVAERLSKVRKMICEKFDSELGEDDMDDMERFLENLCYWTKPSK